MTNLDLLLTATVAPKVAGSAFGIKPRILTLDVETAPNTALVWGTRNVFVSPSQIVESGRMISFAAKWLGEKKVIFFSEHHNTAEEMVRAAWNLINEATHLVGYNSKNFDMRVLNTEFQKHGLTPPSPVAHIDLLQTVRAQFRFPSNKLEYVGDAIGVGNKLQHTGQHLWNACLQGDPKAWATMKKYNKQDVLLTEELFLALGSWVKNKPNLALYYGQQVCPSCGGEHYAANGWTYTAQSVYARYQCHDCGAWFRTHTVSGRVGTKSLS